MKPSAPFDVVVTGGGTAGAATALFCAQAGLRTSLVESRTEDAAGARWVNGVALWQLDAVGLAPPSGAELRAPPSPFHLLAGHGPQRVLIPGAGPSGHGVADVDMRLFGDRLRQLAIQAGATLRFGVRANAWESGVLRTDADPIAARIVVDATGLSGLNLLGSPPVSRRHFCAAAQWVHALTDLKAARAFFASYDVNEGEVLCFTGIEGGYSILNLRLEGGEISLLSGTLPGLGYRSGQALIESFVASHPFVGERLFGGQRAIPLRHPHHILGRGSVAAVGDAACQVFSAHGSGIGVQLLAAKQLAEALAGGTGPAAYQLAFQRQNGGLLAAYDLFRRFSQTLTPKQTESLVAHGLLDATSSAAAMAQRWPQVALPSVPSKLSGLLADPKLAVALSEVGTKMGAVSALYRAFPRDTQGRRYALWEHAVSRLFGER